VEVVDKTVVDRSAAGDGSQLDTRFVCRLCNYDMTWPRVRFDQMRRQKFVSSPSQSTAERASSASLQNDVQGTESSQHTPTYDTHSEPMTDPSIESTANVTSQYPCHECHSMEDIPAASVACMLGHEHCLRALLEAAAHQYCNDVVDDADSYVGASIHGLTPQILSQLGWEDDLGRSPLHFAASNDDALNCLELLLGVGYDPRVLDDDQRCPLHYACGNNAFCCVARLVEVCPDATSLCDCNGDFPLHAAVATGSIECAQLLLQTGAEPDARNHTGHTAAYYASTAPMLNALFEGGCNLFCVDFDNRTLLAVAAAQNYVDSTSYLCEIDDDQVLLNYCDTVQNTPLHIAAEMGNADIVAVLLNSAANPLLQNSDGWRPSHLAQAAGFPEMYSDLKRYESFHEDAKPDLRPKTDLAALSGVDLTSLSASNKTLHSTTVSPSADLTDYNIPVRKVAFGGITEPSFTADSSTSDVSTLNGESGMDDTADFGSDPVSASSDAVPATATSHNSSPGPTSTAAGGYNSTAPTSSGDDASMSTKPADSVNQPPRSTEVAWMRSFDEKSGHYYYYNSVTEHTTWRQPEDFVEEHHEDGYYGTNNDYADEWANYHDEWANYYEEYDEDGNAQNPHLYSSGYYDLSVPRNRDSYDATAFSTSHYGYWQNAEGEYGDYASQEHYYDQDGNAYQQDAEYGSAEYGYGDSGQDPTHGGQPASFAEIENAHASSHDVDTCSTTNQKLSRSNSHRRTKSGNDVARATKKPAKPVLVKSTTVRRKRDYLAMAKAFEIEAPYLINGSDRKWCPPSLRRQARKGTPRRRASAKSPAAASPAVLEAMDNAMRLDEPCFRCHRRATPASSTSSEIPEEALEDECRIEHIFLPCHHACLCKGCLAEKDLLQSSSRLRSDTPKANSKAKNVPPTASPSHAKSPSVHAKQQFESRKLPKGTTCPLCKKPAKHLIHIKDVYALTARKFRRYRRLPESFAEGFKLAATQLKAQVGS